MAWPNRRPSSTSSATTFLDLFRRVPPDASERRDLLVVAGEASGDRAAAAVLAAMPGIKAVGMGGLALSEAGAELVFDLRELTALGVGDVLARAKPVATAFARLVAAIGRHGPRAALLVNYTEFNLRLAAQLKGRGVPVVWYIAPQIWAWRAGRAKQLARVVDKLAVILPFEEPLWQSYGVDARYVGHPSMETPLLERSAARRQLDLTPFAPTIAILPGSRPHETDRLLAPMLEAYELVRRERASLDARVLLAPSLDEEARGRALELARAARVPVHPVNAGAGAVELLPAFDVAFCASGTASLEASLARALPIIVYRTGLATELAARVLIRSDHVGLPNILLGRRAFPELLQRDVTGRRLAIALSKLLDRPEAARAACSEVRALLGTKNRPSRQVAAMLQELFR